MPDVDSFLHDFTQDLYNSGYGNNYVDYNTDHPTCPQCGATMDFHGGDLPIGEGYWDCPSCGFSFKENDLDYSDVD